MLEIINNNSEFITNNLVPILLIFFRIMGVIIACPIFGDNAFPAWGKIGLSMSIAVLVSSAIPVKLPELEYGIYSFALIVVRESLVGVAIGLVVLAIFSGVQVAGSLMGFQMGMWLATVFDPQSGTETPVISQIQYLFALSLFLAVNGHHIVLKGIWRSFNILPIGGFTFTGALGNEILGLGSTVFRSGFELGAPIVGVLLLLSVAMGLVARVIPELQILVVGIPLRIGLGLLILGVAIPYMANVLIRIFNDLPGKFLSIISSMNP